jgi:hypothetical protein
MNTSFDTYTTWDRFFVGVDLGKQQDPTAIAVVSARTEMRPLFRVGHLERLPLGTDYVASVAHVRDLLRRPIFRNAELIVDETGCGGPVCDLFEEQGLSPTRVTITAGLSSEVEDKGRRWKIAKQMLVSRLEAALADRRLHILQTLPEAAALINELQHFEQWQMDSGRWRYGARSEGKQHDDLVIALALSVWKAHRDVGDVGVFYRLAGLQPPGVKPEELDVGEGQIAVNVINPIYVPSLHRVAGPGWVVVLEDEAARLHELQAVA